MTEYSCSVCQYTSKKKDHVERHIKKKKSCGQGIKEIIEIPIDVKCEYCNKIFSTYKTLEFHLKNNCKKKDTAKDEEIRKLKEELREARQVTINDNSTTNNVNIIIVNNYENTSLDKLTDIIK
jgi:transcriptional regulator NrdR family protein